MVSVRHIALFVPDLRKAEGFYQEIFDMRLLMREAPKRDGLWYTLPPGKDWQDVEAAGLNITMVALERGNFVLALFQGSPFPRETVLEIGLMMTAGDMAAVRNRLPDSVEFQKHDRDIMFRDPYGYTWHLWPEGVPFQSNGESSGRWLEL